jgi:hypothetical protein
MTKFLLSVTLFGVSLLGTSNALAIAGGPFDNGDAGGLLLERAAFYQCTFSFRNGNGYGVFTPDAQIFGSGLLGLGGLGGGGGAGGAQNALFTRGSLFTNNSTDTQRNANRSVFYYKGVTFVGSCFGMPDLEARIITGACNGTSDELVSVQGAGAGGAAGGAAGAGGGLTPAIAGSATVVRSNANFTLNAGFSAKIFRTRPTLRFRGKGEMTILAPTGDAQITNLAYQAYAGLINAIIQSTAQLQQATGAPVNFTSSQLAINNALNALRNEVREGSGVDLTYSEAEVVQMRVDGVRRFF